MGEDKAVIGLIVLYRPDQRDIDDQMCFGDTELLPAIIVRVWNDDCVNLQIFADSDAGPFWKTSVVKGDLPGNWTDWSFGG